MSTAPALALTKRKNQVKAPTPAESWREYPRVDPGKYSARTTFANVYYRKRFKRWECMVRFLLIDWNGKPLLDEHGREMIVPMFLPMGKDEKAPKVGRNSRYWAEWLQANNEGPRHGQGLPCHVFKHRLCEIEIRDTGKLWNQKKTPAPYSVVDSVISWQSPIVADCQVEQGFGPATEGKTSDTHLNSSHRPEGSRLRGKSLHFVSSYHSSYGKETP